jgi:surface antigen
MAWGDLMIIRVDPVILKQNSGSISGIGGSVNNSGQSASSVAQGAPSYDGQFGPRVQAIGHEALARAQGLLSNLNNLSSQLLNKAQAFEAADMVGIAGFNNIINGTRVSQSGSWWTGLPVDIINLVLKLGGLFGGAAFTGLLGTALLGNGLYSGNGQPLNGLAKPSWWPAGVPWSGGQKKAEEQPSSPSIQLTQPEEEKQWSQTEIENQIIASNGSLPVDNSSMQCVKWAQIRREELGGTPLPHISIGDNGAHNYINMYKSSIIQINASNVSGQSINISGLKPGAAIVWDKGNASLYGYAGYTYGHVAIVEAVQPDGIWISQANWSGAPVKFIPNEKLTGLCVIPPDATPG